MLAKRVFMNRELGTIAPDTVRRVGERDALRIARVPRIFGHSHFLYGGLAREWRQRRAGLNDVHGLTPNTGCELRLRGPIGEPATERRDVLRAVSRDRLAQEAVHRPAGLELHRPDAQRSANVLHEAAQRFVR